MSKILSLADLETVSMPMAPQQARDYWESGANEMDTVKDNKNAFNNYRIRPRAMRGVTHIDTSRELFGHTYATPIGLAPSAFHGMATFDGECATAKGAESRNWPMGLSSYSNKPLEDVKKSGPNSAIFFQLYVFRNRETTKKLVQQVEKAGYKAIALTVDTPYLGQRYSDHRDNFKLPRHLHLGNFPHSNASGPIDVGNESGSGSRMGNQDSTSNTIDPSICWEETIPWLRSITNLQIWAKGVATAEDAESAIEAGIDGIWVSNHGGRQLDQTLATIESLPEVVEQVKGRVPVHVDGGFRRGGDVFKALALGADFVWVGRPVLHGLQYNAQAGVELMIDLLGTEFRYVMAMTGCTKVSDIKKSQLVRVGTAIQKL